MIAITNFEHSYWIAKQLVCMMKLDKVVKTLLVEFSRQPSLWLFYLSILLSWLLLKFLEIPTAACWCLIPAEIPARPLCKHSNEMVSTLKHTQPGFLNTFTKASASVASMLALCKSRVKLARTESYPSLGVDHIR